MHLCSAMHAHSSQRTCLPFKKPASATSTSALPSQPVTCQTNTV